MLLIDNDIIYKLAQLDLLEDTIPILKEKLGKIVVLSTLKFKFCHQNTTKRDKAKKKFGVLVVTRIEAFLNSDIGELSAPVTDGALLRAMSSSSSGLDIGEMQLLQAYLSGCNDCIFTGDKRFLKALSSDSNIEELSHKLSEAFICFEQIMIFIIKELDFDTVKEKYLVAIRGGLKIDTTLKICFEGDASAVKDTVLENLDKYAGYLHADTEGFLSKDSDWANNN